MTDAPAPQEAPVTPAQLQLLFAALRQVMSSPSGEGEVTITVKGGHVRFVLPKPSLDLLYPEREERWLRQEKIEENQRRGNR